MCRGAQSRPIRIPFRIHAPISTDKSANINPFPPRDMVGAVRRPSGHSGGRPGRPRGSLVAPNGSPGSSKYVHQFISVKVFTVSPSRDVLRCNLQAPASRHHGTLSRRTMMPFAPIRSSSWPNHPKIGTIAGTKRLEMAPKAFRPKLSCRLRRLAKTSASAQAELR